MTLDLEAACKIEDVKDYASGRINSLRDMIMDVGNELFDLRRELIEEVARLDAKIASCNNHEKQGET